MLQAERWVSRQRTLAATAGAGGLPVAAGVVLAASDAGLLGCIPAGEHRCWA